MRVAIIYAGYITRTDGTSERVIQIANGLSSLGVKVTFSAVIKSLEDLKNVANLEVIVIPQNILKFLSVLKCFSKLIANGLSHKYDVVQIESFSLLRSWILFILLRSLCRKFVIVFHDKRFGYNRKKIAGKFFFTSQRILLTLSDALIVNGIGSKIFFGELHGASIFKRIVIIPNGAPNLNVNAEINVYSRGKFGIDSKAFAILFFGKIISKPNYDAALFLLNISNSASNEFEKITGQKLIFMVAGIGSERFPKTSCFIPLGFVEKLEELFSLPDAIVLAHNYSGSGSHVKTIYAFLSGKPVIATEDSVKDMPLLHEKKHFLLFNLNDTTTLLNNLISVYNNKELRKKLIINGLNYAKKFTWENISLKHFNLYKRLLNQ